MRKHGCDSEWIREALETYGSSLTRYAHSLVGDLDQARDIVQETFLALCNQDPQSVRGHLAEWLFRVCRNRAMDARRRKGRMYDLTEIPNETEGFESLPSKILEKKEAIEQVEKALEELPAHQQEVLLLKFQHDLSYKEIAKVTGLSVTNVGFLIHRGVAGLRRRLQSDALPLGSQVRRVK